MINLLILLAMPEAVRNQYRDHLAARFPELNVTLVDHHCKVGPHITTAEALVAFAPMRSDQAPYAGGTIGLVGTYQMSFAVVDYLQKCRFFNTRFVDATDLVARNQGDQERAKIITELG